MPLVINSLGGRDSHTTLTFDDKAILRNQVCVPAYDQQAPGMKIPMVNLWLAKSVETLKASPLLYMLVSVLIW